MPAAMTSRCWLSTPQEVLGDAERRKSFARAPSQVGPYPRWSCAGPAVPTIELLPRTMPSRWLRRVYFPIDRMLGEVINPFPTQLKALC